MKKVSNVQLKARDTQSLEKRIVENVAAQELDLSQWIFDGLKIENGSHVLELCCGTGAQTFSFIKHVGNNGQIVALDISREALDKIASKLDERELSKVVLIESDMDRIEEAIADQGIKSPYFDLIFCAYGLYYSTNVEQVLETLKRYLMPGGSMVVVGPFGPNNGPLFSILKQSGVIIPEYVAFSSDRFMPDKVIPWAAVNFQKVAIRTVVNRIKWDSLSQIMTYWTSSTFYSPDKHGAVEKSINNHFKKQQYFINEKWIMMIEMTNAR
ncbi:MAG: methyltransferase domain-containing protein [Candidatus Vogelbacteria bacterium]|nr:methyltransferase domain-containing protein [Candidatus Vogelbacteria bacterium]